MIVFLFILSIVLFFVIKINAKNKKLIQRNTSTNGERVTTKSKPITVFRNEKVYFNVKGIWAENSRIKAFKNLQLDEIVYLEFEEDNEFDKNAIRVENKRGKMIGYIPRNRRRLIKTLREFPDTLVKVSELAEFYSEKTNQQVYRLSVEIWAGYSSDELDDEIETIRLINEFRNEREKLVEEIKDLAVKIKSFKKENPELALSLLDEMSVRIVKHNLNANLFGYDNWIQKPLLEEITVITNTEKMFPKTLMFF